MKADLKDSAPGGSFQNSVHSRPASETLTKTTEYR